MESVFRLLLGEILREILLFLCNFLKKDASRLKIKDPFLTEIVEYWTNLTDIEKNPIFESPFMWHNSLITIEKKPFFNTTWSAECPRPPGWGFQIYCSFGVFVRTFKFKTNYLGYFKVVSTLTRYKKLCSPINGNEQTQDATKTLLSHAKFCKKAYQRLIEKKSSTPPKS